MLLSLSPPLRIEFSCGIFSPLVLRGQVDVISPAFRMEGKGRKRA